MSRETAWRIGVVTAIVIVSVITLTVLPVGPVLWFVDGAAAGWFGGVVGEDLWDWRHPAEPEVSDN